MAKDIDAKKFRWLRKVFKWVRRPAIDAVRWLLKINSLTAVFKAKMLKFAAKLHGRENILEVNAFGELREVAKLHKHGW